MGNCSSSHGVRYNVERQGKREDDDGLVRNQASRVMSSGSSSCGSSGKALTSEARDRGFRTDIDQGFGRALVWARGPNYITDIS